MSLLAWYPLISNGNNQGLDGIDLTTVGTVTYTDGKLGKASTFTNNSGIRFRRANFTEQTNWSVCAWVKCSAATSASQWAFNNGRDSNNDGWHCYFSAAGTTLYLRIGSSSWSMTSTLGTWYHVCMTIDDNSKYTFYVNGAQVSTGTVATLPDYSESGNLMAIGGFVYNGGNIYPLNGQVQDFRYYNHVLSKKEVKELSKGLCLHVPLDWGGNKNILPYTPAASNPTENNTEIGRTVWVRSTTATGESYIWGGRSDVVEQSTQYTLSAWVWVNDYVKSIEVFWLSTNTTNKKTGTAYDNVTVKSAWSPIPNKWNFVTWTFTTKADDYTGVIRWDNNGSKTEGTAAILKVYNMKLEKGNKATPYIPHSSDTIYTSKGFNTKYYQDCSGFKHTATITGSSMTCSTSSPRGSGTNWEGAGKIAYTDGMPIATNPLFTINFWIKTKPNTTQTRYADVCLITTQNNAGTTQSTRMELENTTGSNLLWHGINAQNLITSNAVTPGTWYMQTFVSDGSKVIAYRNATQIGTYDYTGSSFIGWKTTGNIQLGDTTAVYYDLADFRVYATVLSLNDIKELYQIPVQIDKTGKIYCNELVEV